MALDQDDAVHEFASDSVVPLVADVTADRNAEKAVATAVDRFERLDVLVNNAGYEYATAIWRQIIKKDRPGQFSGFVAGEQASV